MPDHHWSAALGKFGSAWPAGVEINEEAPSGRLMNVKSTRERHLSVLQCYSPNTVEKPHPEAWRLPSLCTAYLQEVYKLTANREGKHFDHPLGHSPTPDSPSYIHSIYIMSSSDGPFADWYEIIVWGCDWLSSQIPPEVSTSAATVPQSPTAVVENVASPIPPATDSKVSLSYC